MAEDSNQDHRDSRRDALRKKIERSIEVAKEEQRRELLRRRIDMARSGLKAFNERRYADAVKSFSTYLRVLEDWKGVPPGGLHPANFDQKKDLAELLLINSVYWHLVKLYDQMKGRTATEFSGYLTKYIAFTKGLPFQPLVTETLRKYLRKKGVVHHAELKSAYQMITGTKCFVATSLIDLGDEQTVPTLRRFRDQILQKSIWGRGLIRCYYRVGPSVSFALDRAPRFLRALTSQALDGLARVIRNKTSA